MGRFGVENGTALDPFWHPKVSKKRVTDGKARIEKQAFRMERIAKTKGGVPFGMSKGSQKAKRKRIEIWCFLRERFLEVKMSRRCPRVEKKSWGKKRGHGRAGGPGP